MFPAVLYCIAVFTILILYYFYKPDENNSKQQQQQQLQPNHSVCPTKLLPFDVDRIDIRSRVISTSTAAFDSSGVSIREGSLISGRAVTTQCSFENASFDSISITPGVSRFHFLTRLIEKCRLFYYTYLFNLLLPMFKYLGLNSHWKRDDELVDPNTSFFTGTNSGNIEDHYRFVNEFGGFKPFTNYF